MVTNAYHRKCGRVMEKESTMRNEARGKIFWNDFPFSFLFHFTHIRSVCGGTKNHGGIFGSQRKQKHLLHWKSKVQCSKILHQFCFSCIYSVPALDVLDYEGKHNAWLMAPKDNMAATKQRKEHIFCHCCFLYFFNTSLAVSRRQ